MIAAYLGRTEPAVQQMAFRHGISLAPRQAARPVRPSPRPWLESEDALLRANAERGSRGIAALTGRTASAVKARAIKLNISLAANKPDDKRPAAPLSYEAPQTPLQRAISFLAGRSITVALLERDMIRVAGGPAVPRRMAIRQANLLGAGIAYPGEAIEL